MKAHPEPDVAAKFGEGFLQVQRVASAVVHPQADNVVAVHHKTSFLVISRICTDSGFF